MVGRRKKSFFSSSIISGKGGGLGWDQVGLGFLWP